MALAVSAVGLLGRPSRLQRRILCWAAAGMLVIALLITHRGPLPGHTGRPVITVRAAMADGPAGAGPVSVVSTDRPASRIIHGDPNTTVAISATGDSPAGLKKISLAAGETPPITQLRGTASAPLNISTDPSTRRPISVRFAPAARGTPGYVTAIVTAVGLDGQTNRLQVYFLTRGLPLPSVDTFTATLTRGWSPSVTVHWSIGWCAEVPPGSCTVTIWYKITATAATPMWVNAADSANATGTATIPLGTPHTPLPAGWTGMDWFATAESPASADLPAQFRDLPLGEPPMATHVRFTA
jgi:hypothetical protein